MHPYGTAENPRAAKKVAGADDSDSESDEADDTMAGVEHIQTVDLSAAQDSSTHCNTKDQLIEHLVQEVKRLNRGMQQLGFEVRDMGAKMQNARRNANRRHTVLRDTLQERVNIAEQQLQAMHERMEAYEADKHRTAKELRRMDLVTSEQHWRLDDLWTDYQMPKQYRDNFADPMPQLTVIMVSLIFEIISLSLADNLT